MTNAPPTRKTHVIRILGTNKQGDILPDIWADVERIDRALTTTQTKNANWQEVVRTFKWGDDPDSSLGVIDPRKRDDVLIDPNASRDVVTLKLCSPDESDQSDPNEWVPIDVLKHIVVRNGDQDSQHKLLNTELNESRVVQKRRVSHYDTTIDDLASNAFQDPNRKVFVQPGDQYTRIDGTKDESQFVDVEVVTSFVSRASGHTGSGAGNDQDEKTGLKNQYLIDESDEIFSTDANGNPTVVGPNGINPPFRLDPYQNVVNVQLGGATEFNSGSFIIAPSDDQPLRCTQLTISLFIYIPPDGWLDGTRSKDIIEFGGIRLDGSTAHGGDFTTGSVIIQSTGDGMVGLNLALEGALIHDTSTDALAEYYKTNFGAATLKIDGASTRLKGVLPLGSWHHVFITHNLNDRLIIDDPVLIDPLNPSSGRERDHIFASRSEIYVDRVSVGTTNTGRTEEFVLIPDGYSEYAGDDVLGGLDPTTLRQATPLFTNTYTTEPDDPLRTRTITFGVSGVNFVGHMAIPNMTGTDAENLGGFDPTPARYAAVQIWTNKYIAPTPSNLDKFVKLNSNGDPVMVSPSVATTEFGKPDYIYNGTPGAFVNNRGTAVGDEVINGTIGDNIIGVAAPK